jgi:iron-sulfur cluster assembly protein
MLATQIIHVNLTEKAAKEVLKVLQEEGRTETTMLRIGVAGGGCSGFSYQLNFEDNFDAANDYLSEQHGVKVLVDKKSALFIEGTTLDFHEGVDKRGFHFSNPNATRTCGCGSSFQA